MVRFKDGGWGMEVGLEERLIGVCGINRVNAESQGVWPGKESSHRRYISTVPQGGEVLIHSIIHSFIRVIQLS